MTVDSRATTGAPATSAAAIASRTEINRSKARLQLCLGLITKRKLGEIRARGGGPRRRWRVVRFAVELRELSVPEILVLGDVNADLIARTSRWPRPGEECLAD